MITGIGVDIVEISRIQKALVQHGERFVKKILSTSEYAEYQALPLQAHFVAKRFAMKEAFVKALGTGMTEGLSFQEISVLHDIRGKPCITLASHLQHFVKNCIIHISVSDEKGTVVAMVVMERLDHHP